MAIDVSPVAVALDAIATAAVAPLANELVPSAIVAPSTITWELRMVAPVQFCT